ncbi:hypothetical protein FTX61_13060 [Nitriliruptoraceae bacterium ZYF776]|nr:hypothetical protein [Profundirhabdus halotolerans]
MGRGPATQDGSRPAGDGRVDDGGTRQLASTATCPPSSPAVARAVPRTPDQRGAISVEYLALAALLVVVLGTVALRVGGSIGASVADAFVAVTCNLTGCDAGPTPVAAGDAGGTDGAGGGPDDGVTDGGPGAADGGPDGSEGSPTAGTRDGTPDGVTADLPSPLGDVVDDVQQVVDGDGADLALWREADELRRELGSGVLDEAERDARLERLREVEQTIQDAPDGSLLAALRDTEHVARGGAATDEDLATFHDAAERTRRADHATDLLPRLQDWADSDRTFVHAEVDLDDGTVRLAEVVHGDLATARNVAVTIPGTGNDASSFDDGVAGQARALARHLDTLGADDTAVVACLCYAPPPNLVAAAGSGHADRGGPDLARIIGGLPVADDAVIHAFGHSYGSTALGRAVSRNDLTVGSTVSLGGPGFGSGIRSVDDLPDNAGRVWGVRHDKDPIALAGMHGVNPDRGRFGAEGFSMGDGDLDRSRWLPYQFDAHGLYYADAESLANLALIAAGRGDEVSGYREGRR